MHLSPGTRLGRYEVRSLLGAGGMGEVYVAYDHDLEREVAVKVLRDGATEGSDRGRRFIQEAKAASALHHPNVAHVYEIGTHDDLRFIAMEIVEGETLRDRVAREPLPVDDALAIGLQIASALAAAHKAGIVHRDIKPENVIIGPDGYAKVLDFGLAKLRGRDPHRSRTSLPLGSLRRHGHKAAVDQRCRGRESDQLRSADRPAKAVYEGGHVPPTDVYVPAVKKWLDETLGGGQSITYYSHPAR